MNDVYYQTCILLFTIFFGWLLRRLGIFEQGDARTISKIMMYVTLPCVVIKNLNGVSLTMDILAAALVGLGANSFFFLLALITSRGSDRDDKVVKIFSFTSFNIGSYAIPVLSAFVSPAAMAGVLAFNYPGTALFTYGVGPTAANMVYGSGSRSNSLRLLRDNLLHNVPTVTCVLMLLLSLFHLALPDKIAGFFTSISGANSTLAMLSIGILLDLHLPREELGRDAHIILLRLLAAVLSACAIYFLLPASLELRLALVLVVFAPIASCNPVLALHCGYRGSRVAVINSMYLLISIACMSLLTLLLY